MSRCSSSPTRTAASSRSASATARSSDGTRRCSRKLRLRTSTARLRARLHEAAVAFGRAIGYRSAGTVEFVVEDDALLLPRAERPHPGRASGDGGGHGPRPRRASDPDRRRRSLGQLPRASHGHAVEVRLYAEDPRTFLPQAGRIERLRVPTERCVRVDSGVEEGDEIGLGLRPDDREARRARPDTRRRRSTASRARSPRREVEGVTTNLPFLRWLRRTPRGASRRGDDGIPDRAPAAHGTTTPPPRRAVPRAVAAEPPGAAAGAAAGRGRRVAPAAAAQGESSGHRADAGNRDSRRGRAGRRSPRPPAAGRPRGDEDGDPRASPFDGAVKAVHVVRGRPCRRRRASSPSSRARRRSRCRRRPPCASATR